MSEVESEVQLRIVSILGVCDPMEVMPLQESIPCKHDSEEEFAMLLRYLQHQTGLAIQIYTF